jgi:isopentenyl-diphosphate delta-isomerase
MNDYDEAGPAAGYSTETLDRRVVLVDWNGATIGDGSKGDVHARGALHRAVSVFVFNPGGELLLQQRAPDKYHSAGLWSNSACTHPAPAESIAHAARRCLRFEMGINCQMECAFAFRYRARVPVGLIEHEYDYVFWGVTCDSPAPNRKEVMAWRWASVGNLSAQLAADASPFTAWFPLAFRKLARQLKANRRGPWSIG